MRSDGVHQSQKSLNISEDDEWIGTNVTACHLIRLLQWDQLIEGTFNHIFIPHHVITVSTLDDSLVQLIEDDFVPGIVVRGVVACPVKAFLGQMSFHPLLESEEFCDSNICLFFLKVSARTLR